ncbi:MAG: hypothetical protein ACFFCV_03230 [Promethearchaeota archaeon]
MSDSSKAESANKIKAEYNKKLKNLEAQIARLHSELKKIDSVFTHEPKRVDHLNLSQAKVKRAELNSMISQLRKELKKISKEKVKKLKNLK